MHNIFISHNHQESCIATIVWQVLEKEFPGKMKIFCSSDGKSIRTGDDVSKKIDRALSGCKYTIFIVGPRSETSRWINLENGARGMYNLKRLLVKEIPMVPLCYSGLTRETLRIPFSSKVAKVAGDKIIVGVNTN